MSTGRGRTRKCACTGDPHALSASLVAANETGRKYHIKHSLYDFGRGTGIPFSGGANVTAPAPMAQEPYESAQHEHQREGPVPPLGEGRGGDGPVGRAVERAHEHGRKLGL